jgi:hypothetical protein
VAVELPRLIEGDDGGFMSRLALVMNPPRPKPPAPKPDGEADDKPRTGPNTEAINGGNADGL